METAATDNNTNGETSESGNLAMFVAATIRDKVVQEQQVEISELKGQVGHLQSTVSDLQRKLQESNPIRPVCLVTYDRTIHARSVVLHSEFHAEEIGHQDGPIALFVNDMDDVVLRLSDFLTAQFCVDEEYPSSSPTSIPNHDTTSSGEGARTNAPQAPVPVPAVCLQDLDYTTVKYTQCQFTQQLICHIRATWGMEDLEICFSLGHLSIQAYMYLTGTQTLAPGAQTRERHVLDERQHIIPVERLQSLQLSKTPVKLSFSEDESPIHCSADFLFEHLHVPYAP